MKNHVPFRHLLVLATATLFTVFGSVAYAEPTEPESQHDSATAEIDSGEPAENLTWGIAPSREDGPDGRAAIGFLVDPGQEYQDWVVVTNYGDSALELSLSAWDAYTTTNGGFDLVQDDPMGAGNWISLETVDLELEPGENQIVPITVTIPDNAHPGDHAAGIVASLYSGDGQGIDIERRVGLRTHVRVMGPVQPQLSISQHDADYRGSFLPWRLGSGRSEFVVKNSGNIRLTGTPSVTMTGPFGWGERIYTPEEITDILPDGAVVVEVDLGRVAPLWWRTVTVEVTPTASAAQPLESAVQAATSQVRMWTIPYTLLAIIVIASGALVYLIRRNRPADSTPDSAATSTDETSKELVSN